MFCPLEARLDAMNLTIHFNVKWKNNIKMDLTDITQFSG